MSNKARPTEVIGAIGTAIYGGYIDDIEDDSKLSGAERYRTYSEMLANVSIVAAGVRYFLNLVAQTAWSFPPSEGDIDGRYAEIAEDILINDPITTWHRIIRRAAMYRFYGFSIQEWTAKKRKDGIIGLFDVSPRAQRTIERWDINDEGEVVGIIQRSPQTQMEIYLPRWKCLYLTDDSMSDSPEGLGIFRHIVAPAQRLMAYENLEGVGFETDLRGVPVGRGPFTQLQSLVEKGVITKQERTRIEAPLRDFIKNHIKGPKLGLLLDSQPYVSEDEASTPSGQFQWDIQLLSSGQNSMPDMAVSIARLNREIARVLGVEHLLLGDSSSGSFAMSKDKTKSFFLLVDGALNEIGNTIKYDLLGPIWKLNGWDEKTVPDVVAEAVRFNDVEEVGTALRDMASAGVMLEPDDPAIGDIRDMLGLSRPEKDEFGMTLLEGRS